MAEQRAKQSNPFSTGGGGVNFEVYVQTYIAMHIMTGDSLPFLSSSKPVKMKLQGHYDGYNTDDCIVFGENGEKALCQIKHSITVSENDSVFRAVITDAWNDYCNSDTFNKKTDRIILIVSSLSKTDTDHTKVLFEWAGKCENEDEFTKKIATEGFSSKEKQKKYGAVKAQIETANGAGVSDYEIWDFFRHFNIQALELDNTKSPLFAAVSNSFSKVVGCSVSADTVYRYVAGYNQNAGTITKEQLLNDLKIEINKYDKRGLGLREYVESVIEYYEKEESHRICGKESLKDAYIPTYIKERSRLSVKSLLEEFVQENDRIIVIYGEPGHGKTSICIRAAYAYYKERWLENSVKNVFWFSLNPTGTTAIDYEHRTFSLEKLFSWRKRRNERTNAIDVKELDGALVFLDGFDELVENIRNSTSGYFDSLGGFIDDYITEFAERSNAHVVITSRKMCIQNELFEGLKNENYIGEVPCFELDLMNSDDQDNWLNNYLARVKNNNQTDSGEVETFIENFKKSRKNKTILKLTGVPILFRMVVYNKLDDSYASTVELYDELFKRVIRNHNQYNGLQKVETKLETFARDIFEGNDYSIQIEDALVNQEDQFINEWLYYFYIENVGKQVVAFFHRSFYQYFLANHIFNTLLVCRDEKNILILLMLLTRRKLDPTTLQYICERNRVKKRDLSIIIHSIVDYIIKHESYIAPAYDLSWSSEIGKINQSRNMLWNIVGIISVVCKKFEFSQEFCDLIFSYDCTGIVVSSNSISNVEVDLRDKKISNGIMGLGYFDGVIADSSEWFYSNFYAARMRNASFKGASLSYCNLGAANMTGIHLENANLFSAIAPHAKLRRSVLSDAIMVGANLYKSNLSFANLTRTVLTYANLDKANLDNAILDKTDLKGAKLKGASLTVATFQEVDLAGADLRETNLKKVNISNADISSVNFTGSDLRNVVIKDTHFDNVTFDLVDFSGAKFENVTFSNVSMKSTRFIKVTMKNTK